MHGDDDSLSRHLPDEAATLGFGALLAGALAPGLVIFLSGDLGSGKTTLVRGVLRGLGHAGKVKSPTYTLVELYAISKLNLHHFDFYRFNQPEEYLEAGLDEYFGGTAVCLVEWPDRAGDYLADPDLRIDLRIEDAARRVECTAHSAAGRRCLTRLREASRASPAASS